MFICTTIIVKGGNHNELNLMLFRQFCTRTKIKSFISAYPDTAQRKGYQPALPSIILWLKSRQP
jgi:hypothetical protein